MKKILYITLALITLIFVYILFKPLDSAIEDIYKLNLINSIIPILIAILVRWKFSILSNKKWRSFFLILFIIGFSTGLGLILKYSVLHRFSYFGLRLLIGSLFFLILSIKPIR